MRVSLAKILEISEKIEKNYEDMTSELMIMLAEYLKPEGNNYLFEKMSQYGDVNDKARKIILRYAKGNSKAVKDTLNEVSAIALNDVEEALKQASERGELKEAPPIEESDALNALLLGELSFIMNKLNEVNLTTYASTMETFQKTVNKISTELSRAKLETEWKVIEQGINEVVVDREITLKAVEKAVNNLSEEGITGFVTKSGREWYPDTYSGLVIRTEAHNYAIDCIKERQQDYGTDLFQVSSHSGARPLCYPYQNMILSWNSPSGAFVDGSGSKIEYTNINETSYGEPAGLFGINCGHYPLPIIPYVSIVHDQPVQDESLNNKEYQESQEQRRLEREIRQAKREYEMQKASGNEDLEKYRERVSDKQKDMRVFIDETGRTRRYDREKLFE